MTTLGMLRAAAQLDHLQHSEHVALNTEDPGATEAVATCRICDARWSVTIDELRAGAERIIRAMRALGN